MSASARFPFRALARARMAGETDGFVKIVAEKKYDEILGVHIIGPRATELVAEAVMALRMEVTVEELVKTIHAHPTMSEAVARRPTPRTEPRFIYEALRRGLRTSRPVSEGMLCPHPL